MRGHVVLVGMDACIGVDVRVEQYVLIGLHGRIGLNVHVGLDDVLECMYLLPIVEIPLIRGRVGPVSVCRLSSIYDLLSLVFFCYAPYQQS